ncbi:MAG TPA: hypothetical protein VMZ27_15110 [Candidatus Saccharimonadales bacterium]|nr:hypothetical protein [Candidatus Saccharimonadales bacterium]
MKNSEKKWLQAATWETLLKENQTFCQAQKLDSKPCPTNFEKARRLWESNSANPMSLPEALDTCRKCHEIAPFIFNNGNTFAAIAKNMVEDWAKSISPVEAQMLRSTVGHYVTGRVNRKELLDVLTFLSPTWEKFCAVPLKVLAEPASPAPVQPVPTQQLLAS